MRPHVHTRKLRPLLAARALRACDYAMLCFTPAAE